MKCGWDDNGNNFNFDFLESLSSKTRSPTCGGESVCDTRAHTSNPSLL